MKPIDIILIVALTILVLGIAAYLIVKKKKGESSCGCICQGCPSASACAQAKKGTNASPIHENNNEGSTHV